MLIGLLARCLCVLCGFSFDFFVGFCAYGVAMVVGCCYGSVDSWRWGLDVGVGVGFIVVGLWC